MKIPSFVSFTLDRLEEKGYSAYLVGGCVRDFLMGITPHDFDITTSALPCEIEECFPDVRTLDIGKKHGTITLVFDKDLVEVTTYRIDGEYKDSRHPEKVTFTEKIEEDLSRRDFTMNSIAYSPKRGFVDPFFGREDIEKKRIVCVGQPDVRFEEDALRIMRALRFSSRLGFEIEENTGCAMLRKKHLLVNIAAERLREELVGILNGSCLSLLLCDKSLFTDIVTVIIPELCSVDCEKICGFLSGQENFSPLVRLCAFFSGFDADKAETILRRLRFDNRTLKTVVGVVSQLDFYFDKTDKVSIKKCIASLSSDDAFTLYMTIACIYSGSDSLLCQKHIAAADEVKRIEKSGECVSIKQLDIKGNEIIEELDINPSLTGKILQSLLFDVIEEKTENRKAALLERAKKYI